MIFWDRRLIILLSLGRHSEMKRSCTMILQGLKLWPPDVDFSVKTINSWHPSISIHILHTVLNTFSRVLTRRTCFTPRVFFQLVIISFILVTSMCDSGIVNGEIRCTSLLGVKGWSQYNLPENYAYLMLASRYSFN